MERKTQIRSRRYAAPDEETSDLAVQAATNALEQVGIHIDRIGYIIMSTSTATSSAAHLVSVAECTQCP